MEYNHQKNKKKQTYNILECSDHNRHNLKNFMGNYLIVTSNISTEREEKTFDLVTFSSKMEADCRNLEYNNSPFEYRCSSRYQIWSLSGIFLKLKWVIVGDKLDLITVFNEVKPKKAASWMTWWQDPADQSLNFNHIHKINELWQSWASYQLALSFFGRSISCSHKASLLWLR